MLVVETEERESVDGDLSGPSEYLGAMMETSSRRGYVEGGCVASVSVRSDSEANMHHRIAANERSVASRPRCQEFGEESTKKK
jgi:hypothetical protein